MARVMAEPLNMVQQMTNVGDRLLIALADAQVSYTVIEQLLQQRNFLFQSLKLSLRPIDSAVFQEDTDFKTAMQGLLQQNEEICAGFRERQMWVNQASRQASVAGKFLSNRFAGRQQRSSINIQL